MRIILVLCMFFHSLVEARVQKEITKKEMLKILKAKSKNLINIKSGQSKKSITHYAGIFEECEDTGENCAEYECNVEETTIETIISPKKEDEYYVHELIKFVPQAGSDSDCKIIEEQKLYLGRIDLKYIDYLFRLANKFYDLGNLVYQIEFPEQAGLRIYKKFDLSKSSFQFYLQLLLKRNDQLVGQLKFIPSQVDPKKIDLTHIELCLQYPVPNGMPEEHCTEKMDYSYLRDI